MGPILLFSECGGMAAPSLPYQARFELNLEFNKTVYIDPNGRNEMNPGQDLAEAQEIQKVLDELKAENRTDNETGWLEYDDDFDGTDDDDIDLLFKQDFRVPYTFYTNDKAYLRPYTKGLWEGSEYSEWTETRQFTNDMVQDVVGTDWSDAPWTMTDQVKKSFSADVERFVQEDEPENALLLGIHYAFNRYYPLDA
jgi:hypothetical protein